MDRYERSLQAHVALLLGAAMPAWSRNGTTVSTTEYSVAPDPA